MPKINDKIEEIFYCGKNDRAFQLIFNNKKFAEMFLSRTLKKEVKIIKYLNKKVDKKSAKEVDRTVDFLAKVDGEIIQIEMNASKRLYTNVRNFSYFTSIFNNQVLVGQRYDTKTKFLYIELSYGLKRSGNDYNRLVLSNVGSMYDIKEISEGRRKFYKYPVKFEILEFNMSKIVDYYRKYNNKKKIEEYKHLIMLDLNKEELEKFEGKDELMKEFEKEINEINTNPLYRPLLTREQEIEVEKNTERYIGMERGMKRGANNQKIAIAKNMINKNYSIEEIVNITSLPLSKVKSLMT